MRRALFFLVGLFVVRPCFAMDFRLPTATESLQAIGSTKDLSTALRRALDPSGGFEAVPVPRSGDWLAIHPEPGQPFDDFVTSRPRRPGRRRSSIYLQPLGAFPQDRSPSIEILRDYAALYFAMDVKVLPTLSISERRLTTRINPMTGNRQILTGDVLALVRQKLPLDAFCALAITMEDLYPHPSWNFVFGQASLREGVGVFSFARYDPAFYGERRGEDYREDMVRRSCKVTVHETSHMFSLQHCIYFRCVMNGSNHLEESDSRPLSLCPVCFRKLHWSIEFDVVDRYQELLEFYREVGFDDEARWVANRLRRIMH